jgi:hypothetical protein
MTPVALEHDARRPNYDAEHVVIATGPFQVPRAPAIAEHLDPEVVQIHSSTYRRPDDLPPADFDFVLGMNRRVFRVAADRIGPDPAPGLS